MKAEAIVAALTTSYRRRKSAIELRAYEPISFVLFDCPRDILTIVWVTTTTTKKNNDENMKRLTNASTTNRLRQRSIIRISAKIIASRASSRNGFVMCARCLRT